MANNDKAGRGAARRAVVLPGAGVVFVGDDYSVLHQRRRPGTAGGGDSDLRGHVVDSDGSGLRCRGQIVHRVNGRRRGGPVGGGVLLRRGVCHTGVYNIGVLWVAEGRGGARKGGMGR